jgi:colanic acid/amylovoran biosynthesis glycosyltransferase
VKRLSTELVLFTSRFPFGHAEQFLESEIPFLSHYFKRVVVVPQLAQGEQRPLPPNVELDLGVHERRTWGTRRAIDALRSMFREGELYRELVGERDKLFRRQSVRPILGRATTAGWVVSWLKDRTDKGGNGRSPVYYSYWLDSAALGLSLHSKRHPCRFISRSHGFDLYAERSQTGFLPFQRFMIGQADFVFTVSEHGRAYLARKYPQLASKIRVARLGVNDPAWTTPPSADGVLRILSCSFMIPLKRLSLLIKGLHRLAATAPTRKIVWEHIGAGPLWNEVNSLARSLPPSIQTIFHGQLSNQQVLDRYSRAPVDVFVNVSETEGIPVAIMEAQSFGIPAVATAVGGVPEIVNSTNGILLPPTASSDDIACALNNFVDSERTAAKRAASKNTWRQSFDAGQNYRSFVELITTPDKLNG